jgi:signal transduction histidine kinase
MRRLSPAMTLIVLIFGAASVLAWQAYASAQSHRRSAERVLNDYVQFAAWEFGRLAQAGIQDAVNDWAQPVASSSTLPLTAPGAFNARPSCKCHNLKAITTFRVADGRLESLGEPLAPGVDAWLRERAAALRNGGPHRPGSLRVETGPSGPRALVTKVVHGPGSSAPTLEGFVMDAAPVGRVLGEIVAGRPLLPPTLAGPRNELVTVMVRTADGTPLLSPAATGAAADPAATAQGTLDEGLGGLKYEVRLKPEAASRLVIGGLPRSRLPVLLGLLALTGALAVAAVLQLRREHQLASLRADFVSSVSHELRTPLAQIRLFSETLLLGRVRSAVEGRRALEIIQQESRRLTHLVENVLFFSRAERGSERLSTAPLALAPLVAELVEAFLPLARSARSEVKVEVRDAVEALVDAGALRQILLNLLDNAVKYGTAGQTIVVSVERRGASAAVTVSDEGPGVPLDERSRIWAPYARLVTASTSAVAGTGIGLAVVRQLVRLHGGTVGVEDAPGGGARFVVTFSATAGQAPALGAAARSATA